MNFLDQLVRHIASMPHPGVTEDVDRCSLREALQDAPKAHRTRLLNIIDSACSPPVAAAPDSKAQPLAASHALKGRRRGEARAVDAKAAEPTDRSSNTAAVVALAPARAAPGAPRLEPCIASQIEHARHDVKAALPQRSHASFGEWRAAVRALQTETLASLSTPQACCLAAARVHEIVQSLSPSRRQSLGADPVVLGLSVRGLRDKLARQLSDLQAGSELQRTAATWLGRLDHCLVTVSLDAPRAALSASSRDRAKESKAHVDNKGGAIAEPVTVSGFLGEAHRSKLQAHPQRPVSPSLVDLCREVTELQLPANLCEAVRTTGGRQLFIGGLKEGSSHIHLSAAHATLKHRSQHTTLVRGASYMASQLDRAADGLDMRRAGHRLQLAVILRLQGHFTHMETAWGFVEERAQKVLSPAAPKGH